MKIDFKTYIFFNLRIFVEQNASALHSQDTYITSKYNIYATKIEFANTFMIIS